MHVGKGEIIQPNIYRMFSNVNQVIYTLAIYHDPSSSGSPDILLTMFQRFTMHKSN